MSTSTPSAYASPHQALLQLLLDNQPQSLLCVSETPVPAIEQYRAQQPTCKLEWLQGIRQASEIDQQEHYDLAVVADQLEHMEKAQGVQLLGTLRNLYSNAVVLLLNPGQAPQWHTNELYGLGFHLQESFVLPPADSRRTPQQLVLYSYDIATYNHVRSWNNPQYWAHPEHFGKYWW